MVALVFVAFIIVCLTVDAVIQYNKRKEAAVNGAASSLEGVFNVEKLKIPKGVFFDKTHTWAFMDRFGGVKVGIDDFLQHTTGPITNINIKKAGERVKKGDVLVSIMHKGKKLNVYSPVSGRIKAYNSNLIKDSSIINNSPYGEGWVYDIEPDNWLKETQLLMMADKASEWLNNEFTRLKDFLAMLQAKNMQYAGIALQDGGELKDEVLADLDPEAWEEFQVNFIDNSK